jgi:hypothetical protein
MLEAKASAWPERTGRASESSDAGELQEIAELLVTGHVRGKGLINFRERSKRSLAEVAKTLEPLTEAITKAGGAGEAKAGGRLHGQHALRVHISSL